MPTVNPHNRTYLNQPKIQYRIRKKETLGVSVEFFESLREDW